MSDYIEIYANQFNLTVTETPSGMILFEGISPVSYIKNDEPEIFYYLSKGGWSPCKTSDLALLILNNVTAHG